MPNSETEDRRGAALEDSASFAAVGRCRKEDAMFPSEELNATRIEIVEGQKIQLYVRHGEGARMLMEFSGPLTISIAEERKDGQVRNRG